MSLFEKKVPIFRKRDRETQARIRQVLDEAGIWNRCSHYEQEEIPVGGYSAMDPRNYGKKGRIDREIYVIHVRESELEAARRTIRSVGLVAEVETLQELKDAAADKIRNRKY